MQRRRIAGTVAVLLAGLGAAACGSTVPLSQQRAGGVLAGDGLGSLPSSGPGTTGGGLGVPGVSVSGGGTTGGTGASTGTTELPGSGPGGSVGQAGKGVTASSISIGFIYTTGRQQAAAALGAAGVTSGDELAQWKILVSEVNRTGGLGGRRIKPVYFGQSTTSTQSISTQEAAACQAFTQDNHVAAVMSSFEFTDGFIACMHRHGVPTAYSLETLNATSQLDKYPLQLELGNLALDRQGVELGESLAARGYFTGTVPAVNGVIGYDTPAFHAAVDALERTLKTHGQTLKDKRFVPFPNATSDTSSVATSISSIELAFASQRIDHVMFFDLNGLLSFLFMTNAQTQRYQPRYGLTSQSSGTHLADLLKGNANAQLEDSLAIGWIPVLDLAMAEYGPTKGPAARKRCRTLMIRGGQEQGLTSPGAELVATGQCDLAFGLQQVFHTLRGPVSGAGIRAGLKSLGTAFSPAGTFATSFSDGRRDGVSRLRDMAYLTSCTCFRYTSALRPVRS